MGTLYVIATPIGNLEDITLRAIRVLKEVSFIAAEDTRHTKKLLTHFDIHVPLVSFHEHNEMRNLDKFMTALASGSDIGLVSDAGTPAISDPGFRLVRAAIEKGFKVEVIPGASAVISALAVSGLPTDQFTFVGFLPDKEGKRRNKLLGLKDHPHTLVFYVSKWKAEGVLNDMLTVLGDRNAVLCREMTKLHEEIVRAPLSVLLKNIEGREVKGELTLVVEGKKICSSSI